MNGQDTIDWVPLQEAFEIVDISPIVRDPQNAVRTYKNGGDDPIPQDVWEAGYQPPLPYLKNTTRNLQFDESSFIASPGEPEGVTSFITTSDGYTWGYMSNAINALWPFDEADYAGTTPPITDPYTAGNFVITPPAGVVKVTTNYKAQYMKFFAADPETGEPLERYFVTDAWGNVYVMHASSAPDPEAVSQAFEAAALPDGWTKAVRTLDEDLVLEPARSSDGLYHYLVIRDSADNTYHQIGWGAAGSLQAQVEGMPVWGGESDDVLLPDRRWDNLAYGAGGDDRIVSGRGSDTLSGDAGADTLVAGGGDDRVHGREGHDVLLGRAGEDVLLGGGGRDRIAGGAGDDLLRGGGGDDVLVGGPGNDALAGGGGRDRFVFREGHGTDTVAGFESGVDTIRLDADLWDGDLSPADVVETFGRLEGGDAVLDFGGGTALVLRGVATLEGLGDDLSIV